MTTREIEGFQKRKKWIDYTTQTILKIFAIIAASMVVVIFVFIFQKGISVFFPSLTQDAVSFSDFLFGNVWRSETGTYGVGFIIINTIITAFIATLIAFPVSVLTALFITKTNYKRLARLLTSVIELLAAIPSIVYGVFASGILLSGINNIASFFNISTYGGRSTIAVSLVLGIMILPTMTSLSIAAIKGVNKNIELGSLALGATKTQTNFKVTLLAAKSGIFAGLVLGLARAFGEATAVSMVAGNSMSGPTYDLFGITRTLTSTMLSGLKETTGLDYNIRFTVGIVLILLILISNLAIHTIKNRLGSEK